MGLAGNAKKLPAPRNIAPVALMLLVLEFAAEVLVC
jgi:hypothetical protein